MIAGVYARKSTEEHGKDADAKSVVRQIQRAHEYAASKGWTFAEEHVYQDDGISGAEFKHRPGLSALLAAVQTKGNALGALIVSEQSRLGRDTIRTLATLQALSDARVEVWSYLEGKALHLDDEMGEVEQFMKSWAGASERRKASQRSRDKSRQLAESGRVAGRCYGYETKGGTRTILPSQAEIVRRIFEARASGMGYHKIARSLERDGIPSPSGKLNPKTGAIRWQQTQVGSILSNETYLGRLVWGRERRTTSQGHTAVVKSTEAPIVREIPAWRIVSDRQWQAAQAVTQASAAAAARRWARGADGRVLPSGVLLSKHLLVPFVACGLCGGSLHVRFDARNTHRREILFCTTRHQQGDAGCTNRMRVPVPWLEKAVLQAFEKALVGQIVADQFTAALARHQATQQDPEPLTREAASIRAEIARYVEAVGKGGNIPEILATLEARKAALASLEAQLAGTQGVEGIDVEAFKLRVMAAIKDWRGHLRANPTTAATVLRKILPERIKILPRTGKPGGGWEFTTECNYSKVLEEVGLNESVWKAMLATLEAQGKVNKSRGRRGWRTAP